jgi:hypothetical protein
VYALARGFSRQHRITEFASIGYASPLRINEIRICLDLSLQAYPGITTDRYGCLPASPHRLTTTHLGPAQPLHPSPRRDQWHRFWAVSKMDSSGTLIHGYGNINPLSIDYACRPRLRSRLTLGGLAWPRNPWSSGGQGSHLPYRYSCLHSHSPHLHHQSLGDFTDMGTLPYPATQRGCRGFGGVLKPRYIIGAQSLDQ